MRVSHLFLWRLLVLSCVSLACTPHDAEKLESYSEDRDQTPPYEAAIKKLASPNPKERTQASAELVAILSQSLKDEQTGAAPWRATPFWGSSGENLARKLRVNIARTLANMQEAPAEALPMIRWFFDNEFLPVLQFDAAKALNKIDTREAAELRREVVSPPHENLMLVAMVLEKMAQAKETLAADKLLPLCQHHRAMVRKAARALHKQAGGENLPPFDPVQAMRTPRVRNILEKLNSLMIDGPATDAPWIVATFKRYDEDKKLEHTYNRSGWLLKQEGDTYEIFTSSWRRKSIRASSELTKDSEYEPWWTCSIAKGDIEAEVLRIEETRREMADYLDSAEQDLVRYFSEGEVSGLNEIILAERLHASGQDALAARLLFPALEKLYRDDDAVEILREELGANYGHQMLIAFAGDRDYARTEQLAKTLVRHYPKTMFHDYAIRLAEELPRRSDDFVKLKLPTPAEWVEIRKKMTRTAQIDFLCQRLRLLNCFQVSQPGSYLIGTQYAEPSGMTSEASWSLRRGKTVVINPETELAGVRSLSDKQRSGGLALSLEDVPQLSRYLRDDWLIPTVTFWRDFDSDRDLGSTRPIIASIINDLAKREICNIRGWDKLKPAAIDREIERVSRWALENAKKTERQLRWDNLQDSATSGCRWNREIADHVEWLLQHGETRVYSVMRQMLEKEEAETGADLEILQMYLRHDPTQARDLAPRFFDHDDGERRFIATLIMFQAGDKSQTRSVLGYTLESGTVDWLCKHAVEVLLRDGSPESLEQVARLFKNRQLSRDFSRSQDNLRGQILRLCVDAGMKEPYAYYLTQLDNDDVALTAYGGVRETPTYTTYAQLHAQEIVQVIASDDPTVQKIAATHAKDVDQIPHLKKWLHARIADK
jgi:hypothetical protein